MKLDELAATVLPEMEAAAKAAGDPAQDQKLHDFTMLLNRFEKNLYDLKLSRMSTIQTAHKFASSRTTTRPPGGEDPVQYFKHHTPMEEPDRHRHRSVPAGR